MTNLWTGLIDGRLLKACVRFAYLDETSSPDAAINVPGEENRQQPEESLVKHME